MCDKTSLEFLYDDSYWLLFYCVTDPLPSTQSSSYSEVTYMYRHCISGCGQ